MFDSLTKRQYFYVIAQAIGSLAAAAIGAKVGCFGLRHIQRGYYNYDAKEDMRKILSIIDVLKSVKVQQ